MHYSAQDIELAFTDKEEPIDRAGTSSSSLQLAQSLLVDHADSSSDDPKRGSSIHRKPKYTYWWAWIHTRMAFRPSVTDDPRLLSKGKKRLILACLALGSSLNGFCSTVYVSFLFLYTYSEIDINTYSFLVFPILEMN